MSEDLILKGFKKVNEALSPELIALDELAILQNMVLDYPQKTFIPKKRGGFTKFNSNAVSQNILSLHDVVDSAGTNFVLASHSYLDGSTPYSKLIKSQDGTGSFSDVKTGLTTGLKTRIAPIGDGKYVVTNGTDTPFIIGGTAFASNWNLGIERPDLQGITCTAGTGGSLETGDDYGYILVYVTETGDISDVSYPYVPSNGVDTTKYTFANLPVSADTRVKSKRIYRTQGEGSIYYLLATLDNTETDFPDTFADTRLDLAESIEYLVIPSTIKYIANHKERLIGGNISRTRKHDVHAPYNINYLAPSTSDGSMVDGVYKYKYSFVNADDLEGEASNYKEVTVSGGGGSGSVSVNIPPPRQGVNPATKDSNVKFWRLYRTKAGGSTYYFVKDQPIDSSAVHSFDDTANDTDLTVEFPYGSSLASTAKEYKNAIVFSDISNFSQFPAENIIQVYPDDGDELTAIFDYNDSIVIFKKNSICRIFTNGSPYQWVVRKESEVYGCDEPNSILKVGDAIYFAKNKKYYKYSNGSVNPVPVSLNFQNSFNDITTFNGVCYSTVKNWIILAVQVDTTHYLYVYDEKLDTWYKFTVYSAYSLLEKKIGTYSGTVLIGNNSYIIFYDEQALYDNDNLDNQGINVSLRTKTFNFPEGIQEARLRRMWVNLKTIYGYSRYEKITDQMDGTLKKADKFFYEISGAGIEEFLSWKLEYNVLQKRLYQ